MKKEILKHPIMLAAFGIVIVIALVSAWYYASNSRAPQFAFVPAVRGAITQDIKANGQVTTAQNPDLSFERGGRITQVPVTVGQKVQAGQLLVALDNGDLAAQIAQARADLETQQLKLESLQKGTRPEALQVTQSQVNKAEQDLQSTYSNAPDILISSYNTADDALHRQIDGIFDQWDKLLVGDYGTSDPDTRDYLNAERPVITQEMNVWNRELLALASSDAATTEAAVADSQTTLRDVETLLDRTMDYLVSTVGMDPAKLAALKAAVSGARTSVAGALTGVDTLRQTIKAQKDALTISQNQLGLQQAGNTSEDIQAQEAQVAHYAAALQNLQVQYGKTLIAAPFNGTVSRVDAKPGLIAQPGVALVSLVPDSNFEINTYLAEDDMAKVKAGDEAKVTLDAYGAKQAFAASILSVDQSPTVQNGNAAYKVVVQFKENDPAIKAGMNANIDILSAPHDNAVLIPKGALVRRGTEWDVFLEQSGKAVVHAVTPGVSDDTNVEILSGLNEGDKVALLGN